MTADDFLALWRRNPFFVLAVPTDASRLEIERAGQKILALLSLKAGTAGTYVTPFGPAVRDADLVRQALASLRDPTERVLHELFADVGEKPPQTDAAPPRFEPTARSFDWAKR
jgi:hypothetical protein